MNHQLKNYNLLMVNQLKLINIKHGFSLLEVVISLFIISITFLAYSELIDQNLKAQDQKQQFLMDHQLKSNLLTIDALAESDPPIVYP